MCTIISCFKLTPQHFFREGEFLKIQLYFMYFYCFGFSNPLCILQSQFDL